MKVKGTKINLKYPKSGSYLSAFVVANIDDEPTEEAIVFYEKTSISGNDVSTLRINFLDQKNNKWESVYDFSTDGTEVERVFISKLGASDRKNIIIGIGNQTDKSAQLFFYDNSITQSPQSLGNYSLMDIRDINNDNENELIMINNTPTGNAAQLKWLDSDGTLVSGPEFNLTENSTDIVQLIYGKLNDNITAVYIDSYINTNTIMTEILYPSEDEYNKTLFLKPLTIENNETEPINKTIRSSSLTSKDIDGDGVVEIPINSVFRGYEDKPETEQIPMTNWYIYENNMLVKKYSSYYSITDGYAFILPTRWIDQVTAVKGANNDIVFYRYDELADTQTELLRICVASTSDAQKIIKEDDYAQYEQIYSYGDTVYLVCIPENSSEPLIPTISEVQFNFKLIS